MLFLIFAALCCKVPPRLRRIPRGARNPAYARDGRLAVSVAGDLWVVSNGRSGSA